MTIDELLRAGRSGSQRAAASSDVATVPRKTMYLHAGHMFSSADGHEVTTILGSCVAVCLTDCVAGVGGVNHYMLPFGIGGEQDTPRFATFAIPRLIEDLVNLGAKRIRVQARLFGGACVLREFQYNGNDLGLRNVEAAHRMLGEAGIPIIHEDVGGTHGRKVVYRTDDGSFVLKRI